MTRDQFLEWACTTLAPYAQAGHEPRGEAHYWSVSAARSVHMSVDALENRRLRVHLHTTTDHLKERWAKLARDPQGLPSEWTSRGPALLDNGSGKRAYLRFAWTAGSNNYELEKLPALAAIKWLAGKL